MSDDVDENPFASPRADTTPIPSRGTPPPASANWFLVFWLGPVVVAVLIAVAMMVLQAIHA